MICCFKNKHMCLLLDFNENTRVLCSNYKFRFVELKLQVPKQRRHKLNLIQLEGVIGYSVISNVDSGIYYS